MKKTIYTLIFFTSFLSFSQSFPDNPTQIKEIPPAPSMWEFEKYGNYPVSMHTGVPNISIPLYTIKSGNLNIPISLSYHASGIKVDQKATWVGLGWNLNAGGAITRSVRGSKDEANRGYLNYPFYKETEFDPAYSNNYYEMEEMLQGFIDTEPDIFNYNFLGYSGKFIFDQDGSIGLIPHNDLKITPKIIGNSIVSFTVVTPDGITAKFTSTESFSEYRGAGLIGDFTVSGVSTWHLTTVTSYNDREVSFDYKSLGLVVDPRLSQSVILDHFDPCFESHFKIKEQISHNGINYFGTKKIKRINFQKGYLLFQSTEENRIDDQKNEELRLDRIDIYILSRMV